MAGKNMADFQKVRFRSGFLLCSSPAALIKYVKTGKTILTGRSSVD